MIGAKLKQLRKAQGSKPEEIAKLLSISVQAYYKYENEINEPNIENVKKLANFYHITTDELLGNATHLINIEALETEKKNIITNILNMTNSQLNRVSDFIKGMME